MVLLKIIFYTMKASINHLWWYPWASEGGLDFADKHVSISIDNLAFDRAASYRILFLAEPYAVAPSVNEGALRNAHNFNRIYTFTQSILDKYPTAKLFEWGSSWLDFDECIDSIEIMCIPKSTL